MSNIYNLKKYDLVISQTWFKNNHGICGHTFEMIEYFWILKDYFNVCILNTENISIQDFKTAIISKYNFNKDEVSLIINSIVSVHKPKLMLCSSILLVDGGYFAMKNTIIFNKMFQFACGNKSIKNNTNENIYILQDHRIYDKAKVNSIEYRKKILFSRLKKVKKHQNRTLIYATKNCRNLSDNYYKNILNTFEDNFLILTNEENTLSFINDRIEQIKMPVPNLFEQFNKYIYTPIERQFDCSPRFIAECKYYNIEVVYDVNYIDKGLESRKEDLKNIKTIDLKNDDNIIDIIKQYYTKQ